MLVVDDDTRTRDLAQQTVNAEQHKAAFQRCIELHQRIEALYPRVEQHGAYLRGPLLVDRALPRPPGKPMAVRVDPIVCALAIKAATTKRAIVALCQLGDGDNAFALTRVLMENAVLLEWLIRDRRRLETYALFTSVMHERTVAVGERFRSRFSAAGADWQVTTDPYHHSVARHVFGDPRDDRPTRELNDDGILNPVFVKRMFEVVTGMPESYEYLVFYAALGSDIVHSGPFSLSGPTALLEQRNIAILKPMPDPGNCTIALAMGNSAMVLVLDSLNEFLGLGLSDELAALKVEHQKDLTTDVMESSDDR